MNTTAFHPGTLLRQKVEARRGLLVPGEQAIGAALYNVFAGMVGGLEVETQ